MQFLNEFHSMVIADAANISYSSNILAKTAKQSFMPKNLNFFFKLRNNTFKCGHVRVHPKCTLVFWVRQLALISAKSVGIESCVFKWEQPQCASKQIFRYWQSDFNFYQNDLLIWFLITSADLFLFALSHVHIYIQMPNEACKNEGYVDVDV